MYIFFYVIKVYDIFSRLSITPQYNVPHSRTWEKNSKPTRPFAELGRQPCKKEKKRVFIIYIYNFFYMHRKFIGENRVSVNCFSAAWGLFFCLPFNYYYYFYFLFLFFIFIFFAAPAGFVAFVR